MLISSSYRRPVSLRVKPLAAVVLPALMLAACASPYRYAERGPQGDPYGIAMRDAALGSPAASGTFARPERHRRAARIAQKAKHVSTPILRKDPMLTAVDKALTQPATTTAPAAPSEARSAAASGAPQTLTESSLIVSSATPPVVLNAPAPSSTARAAQPAEAALAFPNATNSKLVEQGRALFRTGQVTKARERFMAALVELAPGRVPQVLPDLARTYDPYYLQQVPKADVKPNPAMALAIYQRAALAGSKSNAADIERLEQQRN